ncbi:hypothetical protein EsDP_00004660 [Epichloe bromicola]|uniref:Uncharacterized protein n=1 Tax=Epichloe bromicola TaxID=79588 RepID=A0ABQ0CST6_9HYPO
MAPASVLRSSYTCAENVAILRLLHSVPVPPSRNLMDDRSIRHDGYSLPFDRERELVGVVAFLSSLTDDSEHIPAVCVEEKHAPSSQGAQVLLAVNRKSPYDGDGTLALIRRGLQSIFAILGRVSDGKPDTLDEATTAHRSTANRPGNLEDDMFKAIVSMCSPRILCRLRLIPNARKTSKQPFKTALENSIVSVRQLQGKKGDGANAIAERFEESAKHVIRLIDSWSSYRSNHRLEELVLGVHQLSRVEGLESLLDKVPHRDMDPSSKRSLVNIVRKVSRYREAARFLYWTAKRFPITRRMEVVAVQLPEAAFQKAPWTDYSPSLASALTRFESTQNQVQLGSTCHLLGTTEEEAAKKFEKQTLETLKKAKIHAEVQLLAYCELMPPPANHPRVICSSKDACYLCNALLGLSKRVHTPRCHGRLYPGWRMPALPALARMQEELNDCLSRRITISLAALLRTRNKTTYPDPNESTLLTIALSATTTSTGMAKEEADEKVSLSSISDDGIHSRCGSLVFRENQTSAEDVVIKLSGDDVNVADSSESRSTLTSPVNAKSGIELMTPGRIQSATVESRDAYRIFRAGLLEIHVENPRATGQPASGSGVDEVICNLECLTGEEAQKLREKNPHAFIDMEALRTGVELRVQCPDCFYISAKGSFLRLRCPRSNVVDNET